MDIEELAKKWLSENERRFFCGHFDSDEIALSAFCAGYRAAQPVTPADTMTECSNGRCPWRNQWKGLLSNEFNR